MRTMMKIGMRRVMMTTKSKHLRLLIVAEDIYIKYDTFSLLLKKRLLMFGIRTTSVLSGFTFLKKRYVA